MSARLLTTADAGEWEQALPAGRSAFGSVAFARAQERAGLAEHLLLTVGDVAYPLMRRSTADLGFAPDDLAGRWDAASPPFTGPFGSGAEAALSEAIRELGAVAEFAHLHPFTAARELVGGGEPDREIVWVDTTLDEDELWSASYAKACRKNVKRARREGVVVREGKGPDDIAAFHRIYIATMERNAALRSYFYEREYFEAIAAEMADSARFVLAELDGEVIAATLYLHDSEDVYSYLGGADHAHQAVRPTNAVVHETVAWAREQGKKRLILGGGYRPDDGIFRFKASFSPERATLRLARRVHDPDAYETLVEAWRANGGGDPGSFFPAYRAPA